MARARSRKGGNRLLDFFFFFLEKEFEEISRGRTAGKAFFAIGGGGGACGVYDMPASYWDPSVASLNTNLTQL